MRDVERLVVWNRAMDICEQTYDLARRLPASERFGLSTQMRRSAVSVASNIAEGAGRASESEFAHFLNLAAGSVAELITQLLLTARLHHIDTAELVASARVVRRMLWSLRQTVLSDAR